MSIDIKTVHTRSAPYLAKIVGKSLLSAKDSGKEVYHITLSVKDSGLDYKPGDAIGILAQNDPKIVDQYLQALHLTGDELLIHPRSRQEMPSREFFSSKANLSKLTSKFVKGVVETASISSLLAHLEDDTYLTSNEPLDILQSFDRPISLEKITPLFAPMLPRFYSIASSAKVTPGELDLLVAVPTFTFRGKTRYGVASHFLCHRAKLEETEIPLYIQPAAHFTLPEDHTLPLIMIGPGTGVAPYRAFIQERLTREKAGDHWLFFGERNKESDFYYSDEWETLINKGRLKLTTAFSRDQTEKVYVQDKLLSHAKEVWQWIEKGAIFYVCGDAKVMAKAVDAALHSIIKQKGALTEKEAHNFIKNMRKEKRYQTDVY